MSARSNTTWVILGIALIASLWASEVRAAKGTFEETVAVDEPIVLDVSTGSGSITIQTGASGKVEIVGHIKVGTSIFGRSREGAEDLVEQIKANPPIEFDDGQLKVGRLKDRPFRSNISISYEIVVPASTRVISSTGSGSQSIDGVAEVVEVSTGSGRITLSDIGGSVVASTGSGGIRAEGVAGAFDGDSGSGRIYLAQSAPGDVKATSGSGSIELHNIDGALRARAGSGRISVDGRQNGTWDIDTGSGSISVDLPDDAAFQIDAESNSGGITVDHPVTVQGKVSRRHLRGEVRGGGDLLKIDSGSGGIRVD